MRQIIVILIVGFLAWRGYESYVDRSKVGGPPPTADGATAGVDSLFAARQNSPAFKCDGRVDCSQMASCEEAMYFLRHCPGVKIDGDDDGVPCEDKLCGHH